MFTKKNAVYILCLALIVVCFLPWTYHADVGKDFTGFYSERNIYGRPGRYFIALAILLIVLTALQEKFRSAMFQVFITGIMLAYAIKTYILFTSCYNAYCPEKKPGIYLVLIISFLLMVLTLVMPGKSRPVLPVKESENPGSV